MPSRDFLSQIYLDFSLEWHCLLPMLQWCLSILESPRWCWSIWTKWNSLQSATLAHPESHSILTKAALLLMRLAYFGFFSLLVNPFWPYWQWLWLAVLQCWRHRTLNSFRNCFEILEHHTEALTPVLKHNISGRGAQITAICEEKMLSRFQGEVFVLLGCRSTKLSSKLILH